MRFSSRWTADFGAVVLSFAVNETDSGFVLKAFCGLRMYYFGHGIVRFGVAVSVEDSLAAAIAYFGTDVGLV